jgi:MucR family transcriptional regulator, transcriptional regulator of exopolysaccharide biosynthesis
VTRRVLPPAGRQLTPEIIKAHLRRHDIPLARWVEEMAAIEAVLTAAATRAVRAGAPPTTNEDAFRPAVPIQKSVTPDYLICLEDGRKRRDLRPHLRRVYGMTPDEYRRKWGLPEHYPMVAPRFAAIRKHPSRPRRARGKTGPGGRD